MPALFALVNSLTPDDVGARVVVRRALPEGGQGDVLGELVSWSGEVLTVRTRGGELVPISAGAVLAGKRVPPPPVRRAPRGAAGELVEVAARGWPGVEEEWLGRWWLRAAGGFTGRANCVVPLGDPGRTLDDALMVVREWYAERGLPALISVPVGSRLDRELPARGWVPARPGSTVLVQTAPVADALARLAATAPGSGPTPAHLAEAAPESAEFPSQRVGSPGPVQIELGEQPPEEWLARYRGGAARSPEARHVLGSPPGSVRFAGIRADGRLAACGRGVVLDGWVGLAAVDVLADYRRRGLAGAILTGLLQYGRARGARSAYLQVESDNVAAIALYERLGFRTRYRYRYLRAPS